MSDAPNLPSVKDVLAYLKDDGRKIAKTKLYKDIDESRLRKQPDGSFRRKDVDRYAKSLPLMGTGDKAAEEAARRQEEKELQEIRRIKAGADKEEFLLAVKKGLYIAREDVYLELAARALALSSALRSFVESRALDLIEKVGGDPKKVQALISAFDDALAAAMNDYVDTREFELLFTAASDDEPLEGENE